VIRVAVAAGEAVSAGQTLVVLEAMKMELPLVANHDATVAELHVAEGDRIPAGTVVAILA
jgi:biotin carboxyl carrier protein